MRRVLNFADVQLARERQAAYVDRTPTIRSAI